MQEWFALANRTWRKLASSQQRALQEASAGTPFLPRDWLLMTMAGTAWYLEGPNGRRLYPMATIMAVSESLDVFNPEPEMILVRGPTNWEARPASTIGGGGWRGAVAKFSFTNSPSSWNVVPLEPYSMDTGNVGFDPAGNRFVMPADAHAFRVTLTAAISSQATYHQFAVWKNGAEIHPASGGLKHSFAGEGYNNTYQNGVSAPMPCAAGDEIQLRAYNQYSMTFNGTMTLELLY